MKLLGKHLMVELWGCRGLDSEETVRLAIHKSVEACRVTLRDLQVVPWEPYQGVSAIGILAESHISIHTWPEYGYAAVDVFTCGETAVPDAAVPVLQEIFAPSLIQVMQLSRGLMLTDAASTEMRNSAAPTGSPVPTSVVRPAPVLAVVKGGTRVSDTDEPDGSATQTVSSSPLLRR